MYDPDPTVTTKASVVLAGEEAIDPAVVGARTVSTVDVIATVGSEMSAFVEVTKAVISDGEITGGDTMFFSAVEILTSPEVSVREENRREVDVSAKAEVDVVVLSAGGVVSRVGVSANVVVASLFGITGGATFVVLVTTVLLVAVAVGVVFVGVTVFSSLTRITVFLYMTSV